MKDAIDDLLQEYISNKEGKVEFNQQAYKAKNQDDKEEENKDDDDDDQIKELPVMAKS